MALLDIESRHAFIFVSSFRERGQHPGRSARGRREPVNCAKRQIVPKVGKTPNLAARLQSLAEPNTVVVADAIPLTNYSVDTYSSSDIAPGDNVMFRHRWLIGLAAITAAFLLIAADAHARAGGGFSAGSRGMRTYSAPPSTPTAPSAAPLQNSMTQPGRAAPFGQSGMRPGLFGSGLFGGLAAGFLGAGLFGLLFGSGLFGGMGGFASIIGLLLQLVLVVIVARLIYAWWQRRKMPASALASPSGHSFSGLNGMFGGTGANAPPGAPLAIAKSDYDDFEQLLGNIQAAYSAENLAALRAKVTPEMLSYFSEQLAGNASRGLVNRVTDVKLLQGDLAEVWREGSTDYATVAMKFALTDGMVDRASGRTVEGGERTEVTELWTFMRARGGKWLLSAIQQT
jgi:predicted lipid-binding transport protein (Tim44 family)